MEFNQGFLLMFTSITIPFEEINIVKEKFPRCNIDYRLPDYVRLETPGNYIFPCFPTSLSSRRRFEHIYTFGAISTILASLYFYKFFDFKFQCDLCFKNRYGKPPNKIDLIRDYISNEFIKIMNDAGHKINYRILLNTLNNFNTSDYLSYSDFL
ncbi:MAG: hypothetical protein K9L74_05720, partial [Candidatus Izimaplasma sp.]|nr:hypothetical protein [Candidatus Izimaplasma bacterium]